MKYPKFNLIWGETEPITIYPEIVKRICQKNGLRSKKHRHVKKCIKTNFMRTIINVIESQEEQVFGGSNEKR